MNTVEPVSEANIPDDWECPVCYQGNLWRGKQVAEIVQLHSQGKPEEMAHTVHRTCLAKWVAAQEVPSCCLCRRVLDLQQVQTLVPELGPSEHPLVLEAGAQDSSNCVEERLNTIVQEYAVSEAPLLEVSQRAPSQRGRMWARRTLAELFPLDAQVIAYHRTGDPEPIRSLIQQGRLFSMKSCAGILMDAAWFQHLDLVQEMLEKIELLSPLERDQEVHWHAQALSYALEKENVDLVRILTQGQSQNLYEMGDIFREMMLGRLSCIPALLAPDWITEEDRMEVALLLMHMGHTGPALQACLTTPRNCMGAALYDTVLKQDEEAFQAFLGEYGKRVPQKWLSAAFMKRMDVRSRGIVSLPFANEVFLRRYGDQFLFDLETSLGTDLSVGRIQAETLALLLRHLEPLVCAAAKERNFKMAHDLVVRLSDFLDNAEAPRVSHPSATARRLSAAISLLEQGDIESADWLVSGLDRISLIGRASLIVARAMAQLAASCSELF